MGALLFSNQTYRETLPIIDASGLPSMPFGNGGGEDWLYDYKTGHVQHDASSSFNTSSPLFQAEIDKYTNFWNTEFAPLATIGYKVRTFSDWILDRKLIVSESREESRGIPFRRLIGYSKTNIPSYSFSSCKGWFLMDTVMLGKSQWWVFFSHLDPRCLTVGGSLILFFSSFG